MMPVAASGQKLCMHQHMYTVIFWQALTPIHAQQDYTQTMTIHSQHTTSLHTLHNGAMAANDSSAFSALNPPPATLALEMKCLNCWMFMRVMCSTVTSASPCMHSRTDFHSPLKQIVSLIHALIYGKTHPCSHLFVHSLLLYLPYPVGSSMYSSE